MLIAIQDITKKVKRFELNLPLFYIQSRHLKLILNQFDLKPSYNGNRKMIYKSKINNIIY